MQQGRKKNRKENPPSKQPAHDLAVDLTKVRQMISFCMIIHCRLQQVHIYVSIATIYQPYL